MKREMSLPSAEYKEHIRRIQFGDIWEPSQEQKGKFTIGMRQEKDQERGIRTQLVSCRSSACSSGAETNIFILVSFFSWLTFYHNFCGSLWTPGDFRTRCFVMVMWYKEATELRKYQMDALIVLWIFVLITHFCYPLSIARGFKTNYHPPSTYRNYSSYC